MNRFLFLHKSSEHRKYATIILASSWSLGLFLGCCSVTTGCFDSLFYQATQASPSFFSIVSVLLFPIVVSLLAVFTGQRWIIFPLAFLKALVFSYVGWSIIITFGSAGWLIRLLLMFGDCVTVPVLLWFWNQILTSEFDGVLPASLAAGITVLGIGIVDYGVISPFILNLAL